MTWHPTNTWKKNDPYHTMFIRKSSLLAPQVQFLNQTTKKKIKLFLFLYDVRMNFLETKIH